MSQTSKEQKQKILIVDDSELNRSILMDMLENDFDLLEAENGVEAVRILKEKNAEISLVLLDIVMPEMDGFDVLAMMNRYHWIDNVPVIMISSESSGTYVDRTYELGATDYINRPFDVRIVRQRVVNTLMLYAKQKKLMGMVADQVYKKEKTSSLMVSIVSHVVEFRNGESGLHVMHVQAITELLLRHLQTKTHRYHLPTEDISMISTVSALHDIGKISTPTEILNKPGRLNEEEYAIMKEHAAVGADMLDSLPLFKEERLVKYAHEICRWHHERYDGSGYPDGLVGDEIPIAAQVVAVADVYDALTGERVYKKAFSHEQALQMITEGECGAFNPLLLECLTEAAEIIRDELQFDSLSQRSHRELEVVSSLFEGGEITASDRTLYLLERERSKYRFFASMSKEIQFEYTANPPMLSLSGYGVQELGLGETILDPLENRSFLALFGKENFAALLESVHKTTPEHPESSYECQVMIGGEPRWHQVVFRTFWTEDDPPKLESLIGKWLDIHDEQTRLQNLKHAAYTDLLTGLSNRAFMKEHVERRLMEAAGKRFAMLLLDLDYFKTANDRFGHIFGDRVLKSVADRIRGSIRQHDLAARLGGDEFLIFLEYNEDVQIEPIVRRIYNAICGDFEGYLISISMGICTSDAMTAPPDWESMYSCADEALYQVKRAGRGNLVFYAPETEQEETPKEEETAEPVRKVLSVTMEEMRSMMKHMEIFFDKVRLVDASVSTEFSFDETGELLSRPYQCTEGSNDCRHREESLAAKAFAQKTRLQKLEFSEGRLWCRIAQCVEIDGELYVIESFTALQDEGAADPAAGLLKLLEEQRDASYLDPISHLYDRRYYREKVSAAKWEGMAILQMEGISREDDAVQSLAKVLLSKVRASDTVLRLDDDRFLIAFRHTSRQGFSETLERIRVSVSELFEEAPGLLCIGGVYERGRASVLLTRAEEALRKTEYTKKNICLLQ